MEELDNVLPLLGADKGRAGDDIEGDRPEGFVMGGGGTVEDLENSGPELTMAVSLEPARSTHRTETI